MNEVKHIHIGRQQFTVSVEAYGELKHYLEAITKQVGETGDEVAEEVELRMAELLTQRGITADKVIVPGDIAYLKEQLGEPSDFGDSDDKGHASHHADETTKRLFRDSENAMVAGVAAGLARYFGIDPVIIRLIFIALTLLGGSGILIYILLWLLVPEAKTTSDRLSMEGKAATVDNLKRVVEQADVAGASRRVRSTAAQIINTLGRIVLFVIGLPLAVGTGLTLLASVALGVYYLMDGFKVAGHVVAPIGSHEVVGFIAGLVTLVTILLGMMLVGIAMVRRRWQLPAWGVATLLGIFFLSASVGGALAADVEPHIHQRVQALQHTQIVQLPAFTNVNVSGSDTNFSYVPDGKTYVRYHYFGTIDTRNLRDKVTNGTLVVNTDGAQPKACDSFCVGVDPGLDVEVHGPKLAHITVNGKTDEFRETCLKRDVIDMSTECPVPMPEAVPVPLNDNW